MQSGVAFDTLQRTLPADEVEIFDQPIEIRGSVQLILDMLRIALSESHALLESLIFGINLTTCAAAMSLLHNTDCYQHLDQIIARS